MECRLGTITLYYQTVGTGRPIVLLSPWELDHRSMMFDMEQALGQRQGWQRIYLDWPGTGKTVGADGISTSDHMLEILEQFVDAVIPGQRFAVVGDSYGGYLARGLVYRRGAEIDGVLLNVPGFGATPEREDLPDRVVLLEDQAILAGLRKLKEGAWIEAAAVAHTSTLLEYARALESAPDLDRAVWGRLAKNTAFSFQVDALPRPFEAPSLFILGRQDHWVGYRDAWEILENYPRATFVVLDRAGHLASLEQSTVCSALIGEWLDRVEA